MSEIVLSNSTNHYDYSNGSMMVNINPGLVQKSNSSASSPPVTSYEDNTQYTYPAYAFQPMPMGYTTTTTSTSAVNYQHNPMARLGYFNENTTRQPNSPESISSSSPPTPSPPPPSSSAVNNSMFNNNSSGQVLTTQAIDTELITPLVPSSTPVLTKSSSTPTNSRFNNPTTARVKEMITRANSVPMEFYHTEFLEYSKETYEKKMESKRNKRKRPQQSQEDEYQSYQTNSKRKKALAEEESDEEDVEEEENTEKLEDHPGNVSSAEIRRQIHIQSEQKRRAQIKDGFDELRKHLPGCNNKKMSKAALLTRTVQQLQHLKGMQNELLSEVERLLQENESLKKFQHGVLQRQAMEKMYTF